MAKTTPILIDGNSLAMRCVFAEGVKNLSHKGEMTGGIYASIRLLDSIISSLQTENVGPVVVFFDDCPTPFRKKLFPDYKANRKEKSSIPPEVYDQMKAQIVPIRKAFRKMGCNVITIDQREADDCLAAAVHLCAKSIVVSGDHDLWQLFSIPNVRVFDLGFGRFITGQDFIDKHGVESRQFPYYKALLGDKSDNIVGVRGIGKVNAAALSKSLPYPTTHLPGELAEAIKAEDSALGSGRHAKLLVEGAEHADKVYQATQLLRPRLGKTRTKQLIDAVSEQTEFDSIGLDNLCKRYGFKLLSITEPNMRNRWERVCSKWFPRIPAIAFTEALARLSKELKSKHRDGWCNEKCPDCKGCGEVTADTTPTGSRTCGACGGTGQRYESKLDERDDR